jgi:uncharacterized protein
MSATLVVLDTNIVVSALLSAFGPSARVLDLALSGDIRLAYDDRILAEYREVLARAKFGFDPEDVASLLAFLETEGEAVVARPLAGTLPDPDDLQFVEVAAQVNAPPITGNRAHFPPAACEGVKVLTAREFIEQRRAAPL